MSEYDEVVASFNLERLDDNRFRSRSPQFGWRRIYGGLLLSHGLRAAQMTMDDPQRNPHSVHGYFLRPGLIDQPLELQVERLLDGRSIANRRVTILQGGKPAFCLQASFRKPGSGLLHHPAMPDADPPEELPDETEIAALYASVLPAGAQKYLAREKVFELRPVNHQLFVHPDPDRPESSLTWARLRTTQQPAGDMSWALLAYLSDMTVLNGSLHPHGRNFFDADITMASLDHALWVHNPPDFSDWLLMSHEAMGNEAGMGLGRLSLFNRTGTLTASVAQQGFIKINNA
ncbi:acyl-CoA thioesterase domain-containing protein [Anderseniella sp. Alg231-50]|uniref:acyl-CoA thioesterase domain-containing protein n=1 Tax=Anderseniella sp. Alg231-50 TaxID=1922226 RepID=UPI000D55A98C